MQARGIPLAEDRQQQRTLQGIVVVGRAAVKGDVQQRCLRVFLDHEEARAALLGLDDGEAHLLDHAGHDGREIEAVERTQTGPLGHECAGEDQDEGARAVGVEDREPKV